MGFPFMHTVESQTKYVEHLLQLIKDNPGVRIVPMVDYNVVCGDEYSSWVGSFGDSQVDFMTTDLDDDNIVLKSEFNEEEHRENLEDELDLPEEDARKLADKLIKAIRWEKIIAVNIDLP